MTTSMSNTSGDIVLVGDQSRTGLTIIPTATPLTALNYFDGKFLRADDFRLEQAYQRALVALTARGAGSGVVHGFELELTSGDALLLHGGLAVASSGKVIDLPVNATVSITDLLEKSESGSFDPSAPPPSGNSTFGVCEPAAPPGPDVVVDTQPVYLITIAPEEALCGEEERFDQLCADACLTETDRPRRVEGVRVRARQLTLGGLPMSTSFTFTALHLRSRIVTAYFEAERQSVASRISGSGLLSSVWCFGAEGVSSDEVAIGLLGRSGGITTFLDLWGARREMMEPPAQRYWAWRMAMRPWDVYLAQVLQFQCQLADTTPSAGGGGSEPGPDPCAASHGTLGAVHEVLENVGAVLQDETQLKNAGAIFGTDTLMKLLSLREDTGLVLGATSGPFPVRLLDRGFATLPAAGYFPIDLTRPLRAQVADLMGAGVDLRFCVAPADHIPEVFKQAQDMERISLTAGLDDPAKIEPVDILVPDGTLTGTTETTVPTYTGTVRVLPRVRRVERAELEGEPEEEPGAAVVLNTVARDRSTTGVKWAAAGYGEVPQRLAFDRVVDAIFSRRRAAAGEETGETAADVEVHITPDRTLDASRLHPSALLRLNRERQLARARRDRFIASTSVLNPREPAFEPDRPIARDEARSIAAWFDIDVDVPLADAKPGDLARVTARFDAYSRAIRTPTLLQVELIGDLHVTDRVDQAGQFGSASTTVITTAFDGNVTYREYSNNSNFEQFALKTSVIWQFSRETGKSQLVGLADIEGVIPVFTAALTPTQLSGTIELRQGRKPRGPRPAPAEGPITGDPLDTAIGFHFADEWKPLTSSAVAGSPGGFGTALASRVLATFKLDRDDHALDAARPERDLAETVIESIGAELSLPDRDPDFVRRSTELLFGGTGTTTPSEITAKRDWVLFSRRRTITCAGEVTESPVALRSYAAYHAVVQSPDELPKFAKLLDMYARNADELVGPENEIRESTRNVLRERTDLPYVRKRQPLDDLGFARVGLVQFAQDSAAMVTPIDAVRAAWSAAPRGKELLWHTAGDIGNGDGENVLLQRLSGYRGAIAPLIDTSSTPSAQILGTVPDEFVSPGIDGVLLTIGLAEPDPAKTTCQAVYTMTRENHAALDAFIKENFGSYEKTKFDEFNAALAELGIDEPRLIAKYREEKLTNTTEAQEWWKNANGDAPPQILFHYLSKAAADEGLEEVETHRVGALIQALGADAVATSGVDRIADAGDCLSVVVLLKLEP